MIKKAKVYVKNPADAPQGAKLQEGERGGHYYMSDDMEGSKPAAQQVTNKVETILLDSQKFVSLIPIFDGEDVKSAKPRDAVEINNLLKNHNIDLKGATLNLLPLYMSNGFAFVLPDDQSNIYLPAINDDEIHAWTEESKEALVTYKYTPEELDYNTEDKRAGTILHEVGHTRVHSALKLKDFEDFEKFKKFEFEKFKDYAYYVMRHYNVSLEHMLDKLDELLAEDYRQLVGGRQAKLPNKYLFPFDTVSSENYKYKEGRLNILRKMEVF